MISFVEAQRIILENVSARAPMRVPLLSARNMVLAEDAHTSFPIPRFDHSAVDGFALRAADSADASAESPVNLRVNSIVRTGSIADESVTAGSAAQVFTGAMLPNGADTVVMVEDVVRRENVIWLSAPAIPDKNIRRTGEEFASGSTCLRKGQRLTPPSMSLLASLGLENVPVHSAPRIALVVTGSELVEPGQPLGPAQIYNSNRYGLEAALAEMGLTVSSLHFSSDAETEVLDTMREAMKKADVVITTGGVSVGDVDYVKPALSSLGAEIHFDKVSIKPGKPFVFATLDGKFIFGLPGNQVSALVTYLLFVKPALAKMLGREQCLPQFERSVLGRDIQKKNPRTEFVRGKYSKIGPEDVVEPFGGQESHMLGGLVSADVLIVLDGEPRMIPAGTQLETLKINWL